MKTRVTDFILTGLLLIVLGFQNCGYNEMGHANTPAEQPGSQIKAGRDTTISPGNIDRDSVKLED